MSVVCGVRSVVCGVGERRGMSVVCGVRGVVCGVGEISVPYPTLPYPM